MSVAIPFTRSLAFRISAPSLVIFLVVLLGLGTWTYGQLDRIAAEDARAELAKTTTRAYDILDQEYSGLFYSQFPDLERYARVVRGRALGLMEEFYRANGLRGYITGPAGELLLTAGLEEEKVPGIALPGTSAQSTYWFEGDKHFLTRISFPQWGWEIVIARSASHYTAVQKTIARNLFIGLFILSIAFAGIIAYILGAMSRVREQIVTPLIREEPPFYKGIGEFEVISDLFSSMMESLQEKTLFIRSLFAMSGVLMAATDREGRVLLVNRTFQDITGISEDDSVGSLFWDCFFDEEERPRVIRKHEQLFSRGSLTTYSTHLKGADGNSYNILWHNSVIPDQEGEYAFAVKTGIDVTDLEKMQKALQESEKKYRLLVENASEAIFIVQDHVICFTNPVTEEISGYTREELLQDTFIRFIHPRDRDMVLENYRKRLGGGDIQSVYSFRIQTKDGTVRWIMLNTVVIEWEGKPATLNFARDITRIKSLEEQLLHGQKMESIGTLARGVAHDFNNLLGGILGYSSLIKLQIKEDDPIFKQIDLIERSATRAADLTAKLLSFSRLGTAVRLKLNVQL